MTRRPKLAPVALLAAFLLMAAAPFVPGSVRLTPQPNTPLDAIARRVGAADLIDGGRGALLLLGSHHLGRAATGPALFVQVQSPRACGSAGCSTSVYLPTRGGWRKVMDAVSGAIVVSPTEHGGMHDLVVGDNGDRWTWNGQVYADTLPAPQVDLRPRHPRPPATRTRSRANP